MSLHADLSGADPRRAMSVDDLHIATIRSHPEVARPARGGDSVALVGGALGALALGAFTMIALSKARTPPPPVPVAATPAPPVRLARVAPPPAPIQPVAPPAAPVALPAPPPGAALDPNQSRAAPMIIDNTGGGGPIVAAAAPSGPAQPAAPAGQTLLTADEQFVQRAGVDAAPSARASSLADPAWTVAQGTIIPAVLETALNSDLPGYARAIVSRDVRGFDGAKVLVPRGSRLIGQYKSGVAVGQSRAFIIWTRLIRPDGVSVQLASPVMDVGGEIGLRGKVNRHFLERFGSAVLLSTVGGLSTAAGGSSSATLVIGAEAQSAAAMALQTDGKIPPTLRIPLGTPIQVFTARDLDFSGT
jgi:type IV secretion system protein VirB10